MINFSCKHNVLIKNPDGTYSRMDEPYFRAEEIAPNTWKILSSGDHSYLLVGEEEGISVDTGYGAGNIREYLQTLTDKPVRNTINTHHHFDHSANNGYFEKAYMHPNAFDTATIPYASFDGIEFSRDYTFVPIYHGDKYDLGNRELEFFYIPDHTPDGIAILDRKERLLIVGDEFMPMGKVIKTTVSQFAAYTRELIKHRAAYDVVFAGSGKLPDNIIDSYYECLRQIIEENAGVPYVPKSRKPFPEMKGPNGETVYDRIRPHPGDGGAGKALPDGDWYCHSVNGFEVVFLNSKR